MTTAVALRPAGRSDEPFLRELYAETRAAELTATGWSPDQIDAFVCMQFDAQRADYERRFPNSAHSIVVDGDRAVGRIWVDRTPDEIRLLDLAIRDRDRGRGIGTRLLRELQDEARRAGVPLRHSVVKANVDAQRLYRRLGFAVVGDLPTHHAMEWVASQGGPDAGVENTAS